MRTIGMLAGLLLASAGFAQAEEPTTVVADSPYVEHVRYEPAALGSGAGVRDLRSRVRGAARRVCNPERDGQLAEYNFRRCYNATLPEALAQVDRAVERAQRGTLASAARIAVAAR